MIQPQLYFRQLLSGRDFAKDNPVARQMLNFVYAIGDRVTGETLLVDPAYAVNDIVDIVEADGMTVTGVLATHYHPDHVGGAMMGYAIEGVTDLLNRCHCPIHVQADEAPWVMRTTGVGANDLKQHDAGDVVIVGTYFSAWFVAVGAQDGLSTGAAMSKAGFYFGVVVNTAALFFAFFQGWISDRVNRVTGMIIAFSLSTIGYAAMGMIGDPVVSVWLIPACIILGFGETANVVAGSALIGQEAPARIRGSVLGVFNLFGAVGIAGCVGLGGYLFDHWYYNAPFMMMGIINGSVLLLAIWVRMREPRDVAQAAPQPAQ